MNAFVSLVFIKHAFENVSCHFGGKLGPRLQKKKKKTQANKKSLCETLRGVAVGVSCPAERLRVSARALCGVMKTFSTWPRLARPPLSHLLTSPRPATVRVSQLENLPAIVLQNGPSSAGTEAAGASGGRRGGELK